MKLFFFIVALWLILLRAYFGWMGHGRNDDHTGTVTVRNGDYYEQLKWSGQIVLTDGENAIASISPGGYLKFKENDCRMTAESNVQGDISYQLYDGYNKLPLNDTGRRFISAVLTKIIAMGFNAEGRAARINARAGYRGLIAELPRLQMENIKKPYLDLLLSNDSLKGTELATVIGGVGSGISDADKENFLKRITPEQRKDSMVTAAWLDIVTRINADIQKTGLLVRLIEQDSLSAPVYTQVLQLTAHLNSDMDKMTVLNSLIAKGPALQERWNGILAIVGRLNSDLDKQNMYTRLIDKGNLAEDEWINLIDNASNMASDMDKSNVLIRIAEKMPPSENIKSAYLQAAKKISDDAAYGRALKKLQ